MWLFLYIRDKIGVCENEWVNDYLFELKCMHGRICFGKCKIFLNQEECLLKKFLKGRDLFYL